MNIQNNNQNYLDILNNYLSKTIDLSNQNLKSISHIDFSKYTNLEELNLSFNKFNNIHDIIESIKFAPKLKILHLKNSLNQNQKSSIPLEQKQYYDLFNNLRYLEKIDDIISPILIKKENWENEDEKVQYLAIDYLQKKFNISPNNLKKIIINQTLNKDSFWPTILAISSLCKTLNDFNFGPTSLKFNIQDIPEYRFLCIHFIPTLQIIDTNINPNMEISIEERENANKILNKIDKIKKKLYNENELKTYERQNKLTLQTLRITEKLNMSLTPNAKIEEIDFHYIEKNGDKINILNSFKKSFTFNTVPNIEISSFVSKLEIAINSLQIFSIIFLLNLNWPKLWIQMFSWIQFFNFQLFYYLPLLNIPNYIIHYIQYSCIMSLPLIFISTYFLKPNYEKWKKAYIIDIKYTILKYSLTYIIFIFLSLLLGYISENFYDINVKNTRRPTINTIYFAITYQSIITFFYLILIINLCLFRKYNDIQSWYKIFNRYRQKLSLFLLTVFFMPIVRTILITYKCNQNNYLEFYNFIQCPNFNNPLEYPTIFWTSFGFGILYIIGIPSFFIYLIKKNTEIIENNFDITNEIKLLQNFKKNKNSFEEIKQIKKNIDEKYSHAINNYISATNYLYSSYNQQNKYYKIYEFLQKILMLIFSLYIFENQYINIICMISLLSISQFYLIFNSPHFEISNNITSNISILSNILTLAIGLSNIYYPNLELYNYLLISLSFLNILTLFGNIVYYPIRYYISNKFYKKKLIDFKNSQNI